MKNMHLALLSPATGKITDLEVNGALKHGNIDPAFARQDSRGNIWLGTKRAGLYRFNLKDRKLEKMDFVNDVHVQGLLEDDRHQIWITTLKNAICYQPTGLRLGAVAYITKPFDPLYLKAMVQTQLHNMAILRKGLVDSTDTETLDAPVANALSDQDRKFMDELYALMEKRSAEMELNVTTVCHDLLISQSKFAYKLKELTGETPGSFFRRYKLNKAAKLLQEGKYNVSEVAVMIGFNTAAHFSVAFKKQFGVTPSEFQSSSHT